MAAVEGLMEPTERRTWIATADQIVGSQERSPILASSETGLLVTAGNTRAELLPGSSSVKIETAGVSANLALARERRIGWARFPPLVSYVGHHGELVAEIDVAGKRQALVGMGAFEHAWGSGLPFDPRALVRGPWHWDVLCGDDGGLLASLWLTLPGTRGPSCVRAVGAATAERPHRWRGLAFEHTGQGGWQVELTDGSTRLIYVARPNSPSAHVTQGVNFVGFDFSGRLGQAEIRGSGFCESFSPTGG